MSAQGFLLERLVPLHRQRSHSLDFIECRKSISLTDQFVLAVARAKEILKTAIQSRPKNPNPNNLAARARYGQILLLLSTNVIEQGPADGAYSDLVRMTLSPNAAAVTYPARFGSFGAQSYFVQSRHRGLDYLAEAIIHESVHSAGISNECTAAFVEVQALRDAGLEPLGSYECGEDELRHYLDHMRALPGPELLGDWLGLR